MEHTLIMPFWIDTDGYSDRDRQMFVAGVEFEMIRQELESGEKIIRTIHKENESRIRMMCGKVKRKCNIEDSGVEGWSYLTVF